ncbi:hypothetical protein YA12_03940 [Klebsiella aerogenes]|nr:hypothetical protein YA12_03940 [Klebsiella aerogenes]KZQ56417.1 hypothetical protein A3N61_16250 [Klebsiella aerogenes]
MAGSHREQLKFLGHLLTMVTSLHAKANQIKLKTLPQKNAKISVGAMQAPIYLREFCYPRPPR